MHRQQIIDEEIQKIREECDNYKHTVWALHAFGSFICWDEEKKEKIPEASFTFGRRLYIKDNLPVTPDLIIEKNPKYGIVVEAKKFLPANRDYWNREVAQLLKYDEIQGGWLSVDKVEVYDIAFLIDIGMAVKVVDFFKENNYFEKFIHSIGIVGFEHTEETRGIYITLKKEGGKFSDLQIDELLRTVKKVPLDKIWKDSQKIMFYDARPPRLHVVRILWEHVLSSMISEETWSTEKHHHILEVSINEVKEKMQEYYGQKPQRENDREIPPQKWIRDALDFLVEVRLDEKIDEERYRIHWKKLKHKDTLRTFAILELKLKKSKKRLCKEEDQLEFPNFL